MAVVQKVHCRVERIVDHGQHVYRVDLRPDRVVPPFRPGQFLHLALDDYDPSDSWPESRTFSIARAPSSREYLRISYSVQGRFSARMERELAVGGWVWVKLPYGEFVIDETRPAVLLAGGTGIAAFTAFLEGLTPDYPHPVVLAYGARERNLLIYRDLIQRQVGNIAQVRAYYFVEQDNGARLSAPDESVSVGRLSVAAVWPQIECPQQFIYYLSGPPAMLKELRRDLRDLGIGEDTVRIDAWE
jgi:ferredoxin-NADP reductase